MNVIVLDLFTTMTSFLTEPYRQKSPPYSEGDDVREIFYRHWEKMMGKRARTIADIQEWRDKSIEEIKTHAEDQIRILEDDYNRQRVRFDEERRKKLDERYELTVSKQSDLREQFLAACQSLKFKVATLARIKCEIERPIVKTVDDLVKEKEQKRTDKRSSQSVIGEERSAKDADENGNDDSPMINEVNTQ